MHLYNYKSILISILLLFVNWGLFAQNQSNDKPNIIYIYADDLGYAELGSYGQKLIHTPNLDKLAKEGVRFTQHYSSAPVCAPSRAMLMTGKHSGNSYIRGNYELGGFLDEKEAGQMPLPEGIYTIPKMLKSVGYKTGIVGKWGLGMANTTGDPLKQGFDYAYGYLDQKQAHNFYPTHLWENGKWDTLENDYRFVHEQFDPENFKNEDFEKFKGKVYAPEKMTSKALKFIEENSDSPFFLYLPYTIPHVSLQAPDSYIKKYIGKFPGEKPYFGQNGYVPSQYPLSTYAAMITYLDDQVGIILNKLEELGLADNTIVMFSSDNGATFNGGVQPDYFKSVGQLRGLKMDVYEGGIRVPFIAKWPNKFPKNKVSNHISVQYDLMATLADMLNIEHIKTDGESMMPALLGQDASLNERYLYFEYPEKGGQIAIRKGKWKAVKTNVKEKGYKNTAWQLYNLVNDPKEEKDISEGNLILLKTFDEIVNKEHHPSHIKEWEFINPLFN